jgi:hypothetical protein
MYFVGLDLGQKTDHSALAVVERGGCRSDEILVRYVERIPLKTPYPKVVERVREIVQKEPLHGKCSLAVDATGVGAPVVDMLKSARLGCDLTAVTITGGERASDDVVPKRDLIAGLQVLLETGKLRVGRLRESAWLKTELLDMRTSLRGTREHDDLVIALALACWRAKGRKVGSMYGTRPLPLF